MIRGPLCAKYGSSPRLWGTRSDYMRRAIKLRFIPTPVGNTRLSGSAVICVPVHPHACGEHLYASLNRALDAGSSPRLWGTLAGLMENVFDIRFIPTPVGNTAHTLNSVEYNAVHPHACGEHQVIRQCSDLRAGSSPRLWGTHKRRVGGKHFLRFIPTPVGNT